MSTGTLLAIIIAIVVVLALATVAVSLMRRRRHLRDRFGPEYERTVEESDGRRTAERELREREKRHDALDIKPLPRSRVTATHGNGAVSRRSSWTGRRTRCTTRTGW